MLVVERAVRLDEIGLVVMRRLVKVAVRFDEAGVKERLPCIIFDGELDERLVEIAQLRRERVAYVLVCDDDIGSDLLSTRQRELVVIERRDQLLVVHALAPDGEDV